MSALPAVRKWKDLSPAAPSEWSLAGLAGRLVELSGAEDSAALTFAFGLIRQAQLLGEPAAWVAVEAETFFPPDAAAGGVDLDALAVVRVPDPRGLLRAADHLARSGAFGLLVLDVGPHRVAGAALSRLRGLAQKHGMIVLFLTDKPARAPSLGSLISLRGQALRRRTGPDEFTCELKVLKDKRRAPGWVHREVCGGPAGLH
ncbi:MAG: P-loop NTPase family protein [Planctomycetota bacterium]|jgi:recombination protein RecA